MSAPAPECIVCFMPIDTSPIQCSEPGCIADCCPDCFVSLVNHFDSENMLPKCPNDNCNGIFFLTDVKKLNNPELLRKYVKATVKGLLKDNGETARKRNEERKVLEKLRAERFEFIEETFPAAIALTTRIAFSSKLKRIERERMKRISTRIKSSNRSCINSVCNGYLDENFKCLTCMTQFCVHCERPQGDQVPPVGVPPTDPPLHKCNPSDVASVEAVQAMVKCPGCKLPVFKNIGCDNITCANCKTNFSYTTGEPTRHGSQNTPLRVVNEPKKLSAEYGVFLAKQPIILDVLLQIEALEPPLIETNLMITPIQNYLEFMNNISEDSPLTQEIEDAIYKLEIEVVKSLMKFTNKRIYGRLYVSHMLGFGKIIAEAAEAAEAAESNSEIDPTSFKDFLKLIKPGK